MKKSFSAFLCCFLLTVCALAQDGAPRLFVVHEDIVKPSMNASYHEVMKRFKAASVQHKLNFNWTTVAHEDNTYVHLLPLKSLNELGDRGKPFMELETKMGKEAYSNIFSEKDKAIESHNEFVVEIMPSLSYLTPVPGENYRKVLFWIPLPGKEPEAEKILSEYIKLIQTKKVPSGYTTYKIVFGRDPGYAMVSWGKDEADYAAKNQKSLELMSEEGSKLWARTMEITRKLSSKRGWVLPQYSNIPAATSAN